MACVAGGIYVRVLYILFLRPKSAVLILRRTREKSGYNTAKKEGRAFPNVGKEYLYIPDCKISLASFVLY